MLYYITTLCDSFKLDHPGRSSSFCGFGCAECWCRAVCALHCQNTYFGTSCTGSHFVLHSISVKHETQMPGPIFEGIKCTHFAHDHSIHVNSIARNHNCDTVHFWGWYMDSVQAKSHDYGNEPVCLRVTQRTFKRGTMTASGHKTYFNLPLAAVFRHHHAFEDDL